MSEKTYCYHVECKNKDCEHNLTHAPKGIFVTVGHFPNCPNWHEFIESCDKRIKKIEIQIDKEDEG